MTAITTIKLRRGTASAWTSANPTLAAGEPGLETDTGKMKYGNGSTAWNSLAYAYVPLGIPELIYRYTVVGADKLSIDTGVDTPDAGSNDWTNGDVLEAFFYLKTDEASIFSTINLILNNDSSALYNVGALFGQGTAAGWAKTAGASSLQFAALGASSGSASEFGSIELKCSNYMSIIGYKAGTIYESNAISSAADMQMEVRPWEYKSGTALSRLKIIPNTSGKKFKIGSQLLIYKRRAS